MNEATVSGSIAPGPAVGFHTQRRDRDQGVYSEDSDDGTKAPDAPKAKEFGLWKNSVLAGAHQRDTKKSKKVSESKSEEHNEIGTPHIQKLLKNMAARHNNENWTKEQLADLGRRLASVKTTRKNGYTEFDGIDKAIIRSKKVNELDYGSAQRPLNLAEENISEEQLLAKELARKLDLFMKGLDHELGKKSSDRGIQSKTEPSTGAMRENNKSIGPDKNDLFEKGWRARYDDANPYSKGTKEHQQWQHGKDEREAQPNHYDESLETDDESKDDINQIASQLKFLPTTKQPKQYKFVKNGTPGRMPAMTYTVSTQEQPVVTITSDGKETQNVAASDDIIMSGPSKENYVIKSSKFPKLYQGNVGGTVIPEQGPRLVALYTGKKPITFMASWGESMVLKPGDYLVKDGDNYYRIAKVEYEQTYNQPGSTGQQDVAEEGKGLWANIHAKQNRIKNGSGEHMRKPGSKGAPTKANFKSASKTESVEETTGDPKFDKMLKDITGKKVVAKQQKADTKQQSRDAFSSMFGGGNPTDTLSIRKKGVAEDRTEKEYHVINHRGTPTVVSPSGKMNKNFSSTYDAQQFAKKKNAEIGKKKDVAEDTASVKYGVFSKGGSVGDQKWKNDPIKTFDNKEEAIAFAKHRRAGLSKGEKAYYRMSYVVKPIKNTTEKQVNEHGDPWEDPDYEPYGSGRETRSPEQIAKDNAEHEILSKKLGLSNKRDKDSMIGDMTKMLNHFMGQHSKKKDVAETTGDTSFDSMMGKIVKGARYKGAKADQQADAAYGDMMNNITKNAADVAKPSTNSKFEQVYSAVEKILLSSNVHWDIDDDISDALAKLKIKANDKLIQKLERELINRVSDALKFYDDSDLMTEATGYKSQFSSAAPAIQYAKDKVKTFRDSDDGIEIWSMPDGGCDVVHTSNSNGRNHCIDNRGKKLGTIRPQKQVKETSNYGDLDEVAPPHEEKLVKKLKKEYPGHPEKAFATAWSIHNKKHGKK